MAKAVRSAAAAGSWGRRRSALASSFSATARASARRPLSIRSLAIAANCAGGRRGGCRSRKANLAGQSMLVTVTHAAERHRRGVAVSSRSSCGAADVLPFRPPSSPAPAWFSGRKGSRAGPRAHRGVSLSWARPGPASLFHLPRVPSVNADPTPAIWDALVAMPVRRELCVESYRYGAAEDTLG